MMVLVLLQMFSVGLPSSWQHLMVLGGFRGAVLAALILLIPEDYAQHDNFLCLAFFLIALSLVIQPLVMQRYLTKQKKNKDSEVF
jgi:NhaP-type Na+/H+ or K+/H+ antiporter